MSGITMRELSDMLGVSTATISMALNNKPGISLETRERVLAAVRETGYDTERLNSMPSKRKGRIGLAVYKRHGLVVGSSPFFSTLIESIEQKAAGEGYSLSVRYLSSLSDVATTSREDGTILLGTEIYKDELNRFLDLRKPLVVLDNSFLAEPVNSISIDNIGGMTSAIQYLRDCGHSNIGYIKSSVAIRNFSERYGTFTSYMAQAGLTPGDIIEISSEPDTAYQDASRWLDQHRISCTAFVSDNDNIALGAMSAMKEHGYSLPNDLSVVGFDDLPFTRISNPQLTTVRVFNSNLGELAVERMIALMREPNQPFTKLQVGTELKVRQSVRKITKGV